MTRITQDSFLSRLIAAFGEARFSYASTRRYLQMRGYGSVSLGQIAYHSRVHDAGNTRRPRYHTQSMDSIRNRVSSKRRTWAA